MPKISELPTLAALADADVIVINDDSADTTKIITWANFLVAIRIGLQAVSGWVTSNMIETQQAWIPPTLLNSWVNYSTDVGTYSIAGYYKDSLGIVHLRGLIKDGTINASAFTLPVGYRPQHRLIISALSANVQGEVRIQADGAVIPYDPSTDTWVSLDGISFRGDQ